MTDDTTDTTGDTTGHAAHLETLAQAAARLSDPETEGTTGPEAESTQARTSGDASGPDPHTASGTDAGEEEDSGPEAGVKISQPGKIVRVGTMAQQLLEEVRKTDLDEAGRERLAEIHRRTIDELGEGMSEELIDELKRLDLPFGESETPTIGELRIAQAQLVGWLEGLFHGIQTAIMSQQALAQTRSGQAGQLPPGAVIINQDEAGQSGMRPPGSGPAQPGESEQRPGNYL